MADDVTIGETQRPAGGDATGPALPTVVVAWDPQQPELCGQALDWPADLGRRALVVGRGSDATGPGSLRGQWVRQRPGRNLPAPALENRRLSRAQLELRRGADGLALRSVGRLPVTVNGQPTEQQRLQPGDVVAIGRQLLLLVVDRPAVLPPAPSGTVFSGTVFSGTAEHPFGQADAAGIVGESPVVWALRDRLAFVGARREHALVLGPSGSGKELAARALHLASPRRDGRLVARNAATIPDGLVDAELFGNIRDYPNPGMPARPGLIGEADGGTLFLDELGELPESHQAHLLRLLDTGGEYHKLGEARARRSDLRLVGATNRDPASLKHDLLARLTLRVELPPLGDRPEDLGLLARHLLAGAARQDPALRQRFFLSGHPEAPRIDLDLLAALFRHTFTHHVRELRALLWAAMASSPDDTLRLTDEVAAALGDGAVPASQTDPATLTREQVVAALQAHDWVQARAVPALGLRSRFQLSRLMKKLEIEPPR